MSGETASIFTVGKNISAGGSPCPACKKPFVDGQRIAFYGLSYGGETAMRVPTILEKYCLSICSGDFNQWTRKVAATDAPTTRGCVALRTV